MNEESNNQLNGDAARRFAYAHEKMVEDDGVVKQSFGG